MAQDFCVVHKMIGFPPDCKRIIFCKGNGFLESWCLADFKCRQKISVAKRVHKEVRLTKIEKVERNGKVKFIVIGGV